MTDLDKFYSDADRLITRAASPDSLTNEKLAAELVRLFLTWTRDFGELGANLSAYWAGAYTTTLSSPEGKRNAVEWFGAILALLMGEFTDEMDFSDQDWDEIRESVSDEAENLDMELVSSIMMVIVERGKS